MKSKFGIAASAVIHVLGAICMSLGMSGLSLDSNPKVYFVPYLVAFVSLENILVVTRSVIIDTPSHLDVKMRVAQVMKNLLPFYSMLYIKIGKLTFLSNRGQGMRALITILGSLHGSH